LTSWSAKQQRSTLVTQRNADLRHPFIKESFMFKLAYLAIRLSFLYFGLVPDGYVDRPVPSPINWRATMATPKDAPAPLERATKAATHHASVPLNKFVLRPELYCFRDPEELNDESRLMPLLNLLVVEGMQTPVEFFFDSEGNPVTTKGHRRISAMRLAAKKNMPGFTDAMVVQALEVRNASPQDLLCRSVGDNTIRKDFSLGERLRAAKTLHDNGVETSRAAYALGYSTKQYIRDLRVAQHAWMLLHVERDEIGHTAACDLLEAAEKVDRVNELKSHLESWTAATAAKLQSSGKSKKVKSLLTKSLSDHWVNLLNNREPLNDTLVRHEDFSASIDPEANLIAAEGCLNLMTAPLETIEKTVKELLAMAKVAGGYAKARRAIEASQGPQDLARAEVANLNASSKQADSEDAKEGK
jgi:hypothetical protein